MSIASIVKKELTCGNCHKTFQAYFDVHRGYHQKEVFYCPHCDATNTVEFTIVFAHVETRWQP